jgi:hypothetical protein
VQYDIRKHALVKNHKHLKCIKNKLHNLQQLTTTGVSEAHGKANRKIPEMKIFLFVNKMVGIYFQ